MPTVSRTRAIRAPSQDIWAIVVDPYHLPRWWPRVERVEGVDERGFTQLLRTRKGRAVRADFTWLERAGGERARWAQELAGTPFERILTASETEVLLAADDGGATTVTVTVRQRLRGVSRFGSWMVRGAARRQLDEALEGLERLVA
ncbi:MAG TPA: SRPBCC family protein [Solirubrobacteraceae bacterium]|nr:SRPBCC family protein [Solirubrobacteraceae bacterium]